MRLSDDKMSHLTHTVFTGLKARNLIVPKRSEPDVRKAIRFAINESVHLFDEIDEKVHRKLESYSRKMIEGTSEWNILYEKFIIEEMTKLGLE